MSDQMFNPIDAIANYYWHIAMYGPSMAYFNIVAYVGGVLGVVAAIAFTVWFVKKYLLQEIRESVIWVAAGLVIVEVIQFCLVLLLGVVFGVVLSGFIVITLQLIWIPVGILTLPAVIAAWLYKRKSQEKQSVSE